MIVNASTLYPANCNHVIINPITTYQVIPDLNCSINGNIIYPVNTNFSDN